MLFKRPDQARHGLMHDDDDDDDNYDYDYNDVLLWYDFEACIKKKLYVVNFYLVSVITVNIKA
jgi:hypothetical protein